MGMSAGGPDLIQDGLVLCLDGGDRNSYRSGSLSWFDLSGNNNSGSLVNGPTFNTGSLGSIVFDGTNDYVLGGNITGYFTNQVYASAFYKLTSASYYPMVLTLGIAESSEGFSLRHDENTGNIQLVLSTASTTTLSPAGGTSVIGQIIQVGLWYDGTTWKVYKNGIETNSANKTGNIQFGSAPLLRLGARSDGFYFPGNIYNVQIYNRALSTSEIQQNYNAQKSRFGLT